MFRFGQLPTRAQNLIDISRTQVAFRAVLSYEDLSKKLRRFIEIAVRDAFDLDMPGVDKKALVLKGVEYLFDTLAPAIPLPWWLVIVRAPLLRFARRVVLVAADQFIEYVYERIKEELEPDPA